MSQHKDHQMQLTSLYCYFPTYNEKEFNEKFRQETKADIIRLLQKHKNLTDREIASILGYDDPNKIRPRRYELVKDKLITESERRKCLVGNKTVIAWSLNKERLNYYMGS